MPVGFLSISLLVRYQDHRRRLHAHSCRESEDPGAWTMEEWSRTECVIPPQIEEIEKSCGQQRRTKVTERETKSSIAGTEADMTSLENQAGNMRVSLHRDKGGKEREQGRSVAVVLSILVSRRQCTEFGGRAVEHYETLIVIITRRRQH